jgi:hypothetical protein
VPDISLAGAAPGNRVPLEGASMFRFDRVCCLSFLAVFCAAMAAASAESAPVKVTVHWNKVVRVSKTSPALLYLATPPTKRGGPLREATLKAVQGLGADYVRYAPSNLYPHLGVAELRPPGKHSTSWDFSYVDPQIEDAMKALDGHPVVWNFSTIPEWMFKTPKPVVVPADPYQVFYDYEQGKELAVPYREVADYFARVVSWYVKGGFTDELGKWHASGHHYKIAYWEVLNEVDIEHGLGPEVYTKIYDAVVEAVHKVSPQTKFVGIVSSYPGSQSKFFDYFLDSSHHQPGIRLNAISYHFYAVPGEDESEEVRSYTCFDQADRFLEVSGYIGTLRDRLSPQTRIMVNEVGTMLPTDWQQAKPGYVSKSIKPFYWNLSAAVYAYVFAGLARQGVMAANESMLGAYPGHFPSIALLDWKTGRPNARFLVLQLIQDHFHPGDKIVEASSDSGDVMAQAFVSPSGERKLLLVNKRNREFEISLPEGGGGKFEAGSADLRASGPRPF